MLRIKYSIVLFLLFPLSCLAQNDSTTLEQKQTASIKLGFFGVSKLNYYGRTDSLKSGGFFPVIELWADKHFYLSAAPVFVYNHRLSPTYAGMVTTLGHMFRNKKWGGSTYLSVPVYKENSGIVQARLKFQASSGFTRLTKIINLSAGADIKYSDKPDYGATAGIDHLFRYQTRNAWVIAFDPTATVNAGTQQFNSTRYKQSGFPLLPPFEQQITEQVRKFNILSYEFSMPVVVAKGRFQFILNPAYVLPQNLVTVQGRPDLSEQGSNMFYLTAGIKCRVH